MTRTRPNIILIIADDHRSASLGVHGADVATPNLDALAARGLDFTNAHCQGRVQRCGLCDVAGDVDDRTLGV